MKKSDSIFPYHPYSRVEKHFNASSSTQQYFEWNRKPVRIVKYYDKIANNKVNDAP